MNAPEVFQKRHEKHYRDTLSQFFVPYAKISQVSLLTNPGEKFLSGEDFCPSYNSYFLANEIKSFFGVIMSTPRGH